MFCNYFQDFLNSKANFLWINTFKAFFQKKKKTIYSYSFWDIVGKKSKSFSQQTTSLTWKIWRCPSKCLCLEFPPKAFFVWFSLPNIYLNWNAFLYPTWFLLWLCLYSCFLVGFFMFCCFFFIFSFHSFLSFYFWVLVSFHYINENFVSCFKKKKK